jgi:hypothetical protein
LGGVGITTAIAERASIADGNENLASLPAEEAVYDFETMVRKVL